jgi:hypothetical protein
MNRLVTGTRIVVFSLSLGVAPAFAAAEPDSQAKFDFSAKAAGIEALVKAEKADLSRPSRALVPARARQANPTKKSFWKSPWPYVIAAGVVIAGVLIATSGDGSGY